MKKKDLKLFSKIPELRTERLILRRIRPSDTDDIFAYSRDPEVSKYLLWSPHPDKAYTKSYFSIVDKKYKSSEFYDWGIEYCGRMIGTCGFTCFDIYNNKGEVGFVLNREFWGAGIATEALERIIEFGFRELRLHRLEARVMVGNSASRAVLEKCGFMKEGVLREAVFAHGEYKDVMVLGLTEREYKKG